ncbi:hypothetical protein EDD96_7092 [Streptomyces sp. Ag109_G2-6]|nr:hypothetical protein EDD96_7092 [Streptomyces sp. Ag109_G2-6]
MRSVARVLDHVRQSLLHDPVDGQRRPRGEADGQPGAEFGTNSRSLGTLDEALTETETATATETETAETETATQTATGSEVTVTYDMTPLTPAGAKALDEFAADYPSFIRSWAELITAHLA